MFKKVIAIFCIIALQGVLGWGTKPAYSVGAVEDGLIAYWPFDRDNVTAKKSATDIFGEEVAVMIGDPELAKAADCKIGECILFDGSVDYLLVEEDPKNKFDRDWDEITLEVWAYINALDDSWNRMISLDNTASGNSSVASLYYDDNDDRWNFFVKGSKGGTDPAAHDIKGDIPTKKWLHLVGTYDGDTVILYIDGKQANKYSIKGGPLKKGGIMLAIGDRTDGCDCDTIQGYLDEFRIYDRALTAAEAANNFRAEGLAVQPADKLSTTWGALKLKRH